jgi:hypothetical protein
VGLDVTLHGYAMIVGEDSTSISSTKPPTGRRWDKCKRVAVPGTKMFVCRQGRLHSTQQDGFLLPIILVM